MCDCEDKYELTRRDLVVKAGLGAVGVLSLGSGLAGEAAAAAFREASPAEKLRIALLLPGSVSDQGYNADGKRTADAIKRQVGADVSFVEGVSVPNQADVYRQFASKGFNLVIGWGGQFTDGAVTVAKEFPKVKFLVVNSGVSNRKNLASYDQNSWQWQFIGGFVLAKLSKSGTVGFVGGQCFPGTAQTWHGTEQGAKFANPKIKFLSTFTNDFEDPTKAQQAAQAMIERGADALSGNLNNGWFGVYRAAEAAGNLPVVTEWADNHQLAPKVIASTVLKTQARFVVQIAKALKNGTFQGKHYQFGLPPKGGPAVSKTAVLPQSIYKQALALQAKIISGNVRPKQDISCPK